MPGVTIRHLGLALLLATACSAVFETRVFTHVEAVRIKASGTPVSPQDGVVRVRISADRTNALPSPFAIIANIRNTSPAPQRVSISVDDAPVCEVEIEGGRTRRVDCAQPPAGSDTYSDSHDVVFQTATSDWTLESLELATYHGRSSGLATAFVLPATLNRHVRPPFAWTVVVWLLLVAAFVIPLPRSPASSPLDVAAFRTLAGVVGVMFAVVLVAPLVSPYLIVLSTWTFFGWLAAVGVARVSLFFGREGRARVFRAVDTPLARAPFMQVAGVGLLVGWVFFSFAAGLVRAADNNVSVLLRISPTFFDRSPFVRDHPDIRERMVFEESGGYDGQFFYQMAFDPFLTAYRGDPARYRAFIDTPPYRYGRIGFSVMTKVLSADRPQWYPAVMVALVISSLAVCGALLAAFARHHGASVWYGALVLLVPGYWCSAELTLPEPLAAAFFLGGYLCLMRKSWWAAGALFGVSLLVRETGGALVLALAAATFLAGTRREGAIVALLAFAPIALWKLFVGWVFFPDWGWEAFAHSPDNFNLPLRGVWELWSRIANGTYADGLSDAVRAGLIFPVVVGAAVVLAGVAAVRRSSPLAIAGLVYAAIAVTMNYRAIWVSVVNAQRLTIDLFLCLALVFLSLPRESRGLTLAFRGFWLATALYVFFGTYNALQTLRALLPWA